jgi:hypothetical protein
MHKGSPVEIQTPTQWNLIDRSVTAPPPVLSPSSIPPPRWSHCACIAEGKIRHAFQNDIISIFSPFFLNCVSLKLNLS